MRRRIPICSCTHSLSSIQQGLRQHILGLSPKPLLFRPSSLIEYWLEPTCLLDLWQELRRGSPVPVCCRFAVVDGYSPPCGVVGRMRLCKEDPHIFLWTKRTQRHPHYHLVKPLSPTKLVHPNDGSVIPSIRFPVGKYFIMTARFRFLPLRACGFLISHPALWIDVQSLPQGCSFLMPTHQERNYPSHQQTSYQRLLSASHPPLLRGFG